MAPVSTLVYRVEIEFVPGSGVYTNVSARVETLTINRPKPSRLGEGTPTTLTLEMQNHPATAAEVAAWGTAGGVDFCPFSTDSGPAAFYPNVERDRMIKITAVWAGKASTNRRF